MKKLDKKSKFETLKKVREFKKILDTVEIYDTVIGKDSLKYLDLVARVRRFQIEAFKNEVKEIKKALEDLKKKKTKGRRGGGGRGSKVKDATDKAILDSTNDKKDDSIQKLIKGIVCSKDMEDVRKAIQSYAALICQSGALKLYTNGTLSKVVGNMLTVVTQNFNNVVLKGHIGWDSSGWNASKEIFDVMTVAFACLAQLKVVFEFVKGIFKRSFRFVSRPFRSGNPPSSGTGRGDGGDDDDSPGGPGSGPSAFDRQQRLKLNQLLQQQQTNIESGISGASGTSGTSGQGSTQPSSGSGSTQPPSGSGSTPDEDPKAGDPTSGPGGAGIRITPMPFTPQFPPGYPVPPLDPNDLPDIPFFGGNAQPNVNQFGGGNPTANVDATPWDPYNIVTGLAAAATTYFTASGVNDYYNSNNVQGEACELGGGGELGGSGERQGDDGLGFDGEPDEGEPGRDSEPEDPARDRKLTPEEQAAMDELEGPESAMATAGGLLTGGKAILTTGFDAIRAAQVASKVFDQIAAAAPSLETIDESVQLRDTLASQQVIQGNVQNQLIRQMVEPADENILQQELEVVESLMQEAFEILDNIESGNIPLEQGLKIRHGGTRCLDQNKFAALKAEGSKS